VWARQMRKEPRRCLKCQSLTARQLAAECNQQGVCGTCGRDHCMDEFSETNRDAFWCVSCSTSGHTSWDRLCPVFLVASKCMEELDPEHSYKYFPGQEAWMWEQQPGYGKYSLVSRQGPPDVFTQDAQEDDQQRHQTRFDACTRDNGWPVQLNMNRVATRGWSAEQATERSASRQSRLDEYTLTATGSITCEHQASVPT